MMQTGRVRVEAGNVTFVVQHELWDGNIQDHSDQGVVILVEVGDADRAALQLLRPREELCLRAGH